MSLEGRVAVITGATSGIGFRTACALSRRGVKLVLGGRRAEILEQHCDVLPGALPLAADIADPETPARLISLAKEQHGGLDIVINNAGQAYNGPIEEIDVEQICQMARVNVEAAFRMAYLAMKHFREIGRGHLVNTSSVLGFKVRPLAGAYAGTKYAIEALSEALRLELAGTPIKVTCIEPGLVITDLHRDHEKRPEVAQDVSEPLMPEEVAEMVVYALEQPDHISTPRLMILPQCQAI